MADFFFWNSGTLIQRTLEGLLRTILWKTLSAYDELIPVVLGDEATQINANLIQQGNFRWSLARLRQLVENLVKQTRVRLKLFLLIDGLDENAGDLFEMAEWLVATASENIKIVLSSRPYNVFRETFAELPQLRLQDLSKHDMATYVDGTLHKHARMR
jgi:hypothetical protein